MSWEQIMSKAKMPDHLKEIEKRALSIKKTIAYLKGKNKSAIQLEKVLENLREKYRQELIKLSTLKKNK